MTEPNSSSPVVTLPYVVYEAMAICYYGGGPRHRTAPQEQGLSGGTPDEPEVQRELAEAQEVDIEKILKSLGRGGRHNPGVMIPPGAVPASRFARERAGINQRESVLSSQGVMESNDGGTAERTDQAADEEA